MLIDDVDRIGQRRFFVGAFVHRAEQRGRQGDQRLITFDDGEVQRRGTFLDRVDDRCVRIGLILFDICFQRVGSAVMTSAGRGGEDQDIQWYRLSFQMNRAANIHCSVAGTYIIAYSLKECNADFGETEKICIIICHS